MYENWDFPNHYLVDTHYVIPISCQYLTFDPSLGLEVDLPEAVIVLTMTALNPFTGTVLSSKSGVTGAVGDGVMGGRCDGVGGGEGGAMAVAV